MFPVKTNFTFLKRSQDANENNSHYMAPIISCRLAACKANCFYRGIKMFWLSGLKNYENIRAWIN